MCKTGLCSGHRTDMCLIVIEVQAGSRQEGVLLQQAVALGLTCHNPPAKPLTLSSAVFYLNLGSRRFPQPTTACQFPGELVDGKYKIGTEVVSISLVWRVELSQVWPKALL